MPAAADLRTPLTFRLATSSSPGAIAIIELIGDADDSLRTLFGGERWAAGAMRLRRLADIDTALVVRVSKTLVWLMPHGGPRIVQRIALWLVDSGLTPLAPPDPSTVWPEAESPVEALALAALSRAASPLAVDLLLDQPRRWSEYQDQPTESIESIRARSHLLNRLIDPPLVIIAGRPNVGKSTLTNALLGREGSITSDARGTTRDYLVSTLDLGGLVVRWCDTPGRHDAADLTERQAIALAAQLIDHADLLIEAAAPQIAWPDLPRYSDLRVVLKSDLPAAEPDQRADLSVSAVTGSGIPALVERIRDLLVPRSALIHPRPWLLDERLSPG